MYFWYCRIQRHGASSPALLPAQKLMGNAGPGVGVTPSADVVMGTRTPVIDAPAEPNLGTVP